MKMTLLVLLVAGCGLINKKGLFDVWTDTTSKAILDLSYAHIGANTIRLSTSAGSCLATWAFAGSETEGQLTITDTVTDTDEIKAECDNLDGIYRYSVDGDKLRICKEGLPDSECDEFT